MGLLNLSKGSPAEVSGIKARSGLLIRWPKGAFGQGERKRKRVGRLAQIGAMVAVVKCQ